MGRIGFSLTPSPAIQTLLELLIFSPSATNFLTEGGEQLKLVEDVSGCKQSKLRFLVHWMIIF